jgi:hypothetical protein
MVIDFTKFNFRQASTARQHPKDTTIGVPVVLDCGHQHIFVDATVPKERSPTGADKYYCEKCAKGDKTGTGEYGFCKNTVWHEIVQAGEPVFIPQP